MEEVERERLVKMKRMGERNEMYKGEEIGRVLSSFLFCLVFSFSLSLEVSPTHFTKKDIVIITISMNNISKRKIIVECPTWEGEDEGLFFGMTAATYARRYI